MNRDEFYQSLRTFFQERHPELDATTISEHDNLWDKGVVDSFTTVDLLVHIQERLERRISVGRYSPRTFHTMQRMYDAFVEKAPEETRT